MNRIIKTTLIVLTSLFFCYLSYKLCYFIAEKYFFDKFFYFKNINYGYWITGENLTLKDFGIRSQDILNLTEAKNQNFIDSENDNYYKIAVIGDSYVWGQGVKEKQRFTVLLQNKLNKIKPTKVYSFGNSGDNIFDNYLKYKKSIDIYGKMDLYIFGLVNNDLIINPYDHYHTNTEIINKLKMNCNSSSPIVSDLIFDPNKVVSNELADYGNRILDSLEQDTQNFCYFKQISNLFPKEKTLFITFDSILSDNFAETKFSNLMTQHFSPIVVPKVKKIKPFLFVSKKDPHPSKFAHKIYAETLFTEITTNPKWEFIKLK